MNSQDLAKKLAEPFAPDAIEWRIGSTNQDKTRGLALAYVTNRAIQDRLDDVCGIDGWKNCFRRWGEKGAICGISIRLESGEWLTKWDGAGDTDIESVKGGLSDSMKRAAVQWGIGRYLYQLESQWVELKQQGRSYIPAKIPTLPSWALPEGHKQIKDAATDEPKDMADMCLDGTVDEQIEALRQSIGMSDAGMETLRAKAKGSKDKLLAMLQYIKANPKTKAS